MLEALYDKVSPGGFVIVDDCVPFVGCRQAVSDFSERRGIRPDLVPVDNMAVFWRVPGGR